MNVKLRNREGFQLKSQKPLQFDLKYMNKRPIKHSKFHVFLLGIEPAIVSNYSNVKDESPIAIVSARFSKSITRN
jgi:hypothetical protein